MMTYQWLDNQQPKTWFFVLRVILKGLLLFAACNLVFAVTFPMQWLGSLSLYNTVIDGRTRFSYGEVPNLDNSVITSNLSALFASHQISQPKADDAYRVVMLGDSGTWGWFLREDETLNMLLNAADYTVDGQRVVIYNLAYPQGSVVKDLLILNEAMTYEPDAVLWMASLSAMEQARRTDVPLLQDNAALANQIADEYGLDITLDEPELSLWERTIIGQRSELSLLAQLQTYGLTYAATGIDQHIPDEYPQVRNDLSASEAWSDFDAPTELTADDFSFDVLAAGQSMIGDKPLIIINQPIFIADGNNSDSRYNSLYPKWAYDQYREILAEQGQLAGWVYGDVWNAVPSERYTNSPLHYDAQGAAMVVDALGDILMQAIQN